MTMFTGAEVATLWRYPVKSMQGEKLNAADITPGGLLGDRRFAVVDSATAGQALPAVRVTMPDGTTATTEEVDTWELPTGTFFDSAAVHVVTTTTLDKLRSLYPAGRFEPRRFRPNIIMTTLPQGDLPHDRGILKTVVEHNGAAVGVYADILSGGPARRGDTLTVL